MINSRLLIEDLEGVKKQLSWKAVPANEVEEAARLVRQKNQFIKQVEQLQAQRNQFAKSIGEFLSQNETDKANEAKKQSTLIKDQLKELEDQLKQRSRELKSCLLRIPNLPDAGAPRGRSAKDNVEVKKEVPENLGQITCPPHWDIGTELGLLDQERAAKISGSLFTLFCGSGAKLLRALIHLAYQLYQKDYTEFIVPSFVNSKTFTGTGHLPKFSGDAYHITQDDLWAIPTGEVPLTALHREEILSEKDLPLKYMTYTPCFRREAGSAGQETRGLQRLHEFHKVELVKFCHPEKSHEELNSLLEDALKPIKLLNLPYRVLDLCTGELTYASARTYDIEVYAPGIKQWLEVSSVGLFTDYQMRRCRTRFRSGKKLLFPHSLNGSGLATPRVLAALLEHNYQKDGRVYIPEPLQDFMGCKYIEKRTA